ncbi:MAG: SlyX family protein [Oceanococcus sp.]
MSSMDTQDAIIDLQARVAHQDDTLLKLNDVIAHQQGELLRLNQNVKILAEQLRSVREANPSDGGGSGEYELPPHY